MEAFHSQGFLLLHKMVTLSTRKEPEEGGRKRGEGHGNGAVKRHENYFPCSSLNMYFIDKMFQLEL